MQLVNKVRKQQKLGTNAIRCENTHEKRYEKFKLLQKRLKKRFQTVSAFCIFAFSAFIN